MVIFHNHSKPSVIDKIIPFIITCEYLVPTYLSTGKPNYTAEGIVRKLSILVVSEIQSDDYCGSSILKQLNATWHQLGVAGS